MLAENVGACVGKVASEVIGKVSEPYISPKKHSVRGTDESLQFGFEVKPYSFNCVRSSLEDQSVTLNMPSSIITFNATQTSRNFQGNRKVISGMSTSF